MPHADSSWVPEEITTKEQFYQHVQEQLIALLEGSRYWVSNLSQTSALLYHSFLGSKLYGGDTHAPTVNWVGFYLHPPSSNLTPPAPLILGPYQGRPACLFITPIPGKGVCADAFTGSKAVVVEDVDAYPGHIACDGDTKSEIVLPLIVKTEDGDSRTIGVLDLDSSQLGTFDEEDRKGLEGIIRILAKGSDWS